MTKNDLIMKKRLRKKLMLREFQQLGFRFRFDFVEPVDESKEWEFLEALMAYEDANGISAGGGPNSFYVYSESIRASVTPQQRQNLIEWLKQRTDIRNVEVKPLTDAWYPRRARGQVPQNPNEVSVRFSKLLGTPNKFFLPCNTKTALALLPK
jgi:uncharacterized protein YggL (DUF469 family)